LRTRRIGSQPFCHLRLPSPRVASQREASFGKRAIRDASYPPIFIRRPDPRSPFLHRPFGVGHVRREGFFGSEPLIDFCNETTTCGHIRVSASASAARPCAPCEAPDPQAFELRPPRRNVTGRSRRAARCTTGADSLRIPTLILARSAKVQMQAEHPKAKDSLPFRAFCERPSFEGVEHPLSPTCCHVRLENGYSVSRCTIAPSFLGRRGAALDITSGPRLSLYHLPAKADGFPKAWMPSTDRGHSTHGLPRDSRS